MYFTIRARAKLSIGDYQGSRGEAQPCKLGVKAAANSLADAAVLPATCHAGTRTSSTATATARTTAFTSGPHGADGSGSSKDGNKDSAAAWRGQIAHEVLWVMLIRRLSFQSFTIIVIIDP
ncbi:hypothetical protein MY4824_001509 [Beauveria thailandica]